LVQNGGAGTILLGDASLSRYDLRFKGQIVSGNEGFVALFHRTSDDNVRFFHVGELAGKRVDAGFLFQGKEGGQSQAVQTVHGQWYDVLIKIRGPEFWCYLDNQELFHNVDERFTTGRIGLATWDANARYRDIRVATPEGKTLWQGPPELPVNSVAGTAGSATEKPAQAQVAKPTVRSPVKNLARGSVGSSPRSPAIVLSGTWRVEGSHLVQADSAKDQMSTVLFGDPDWTNYDFTVDLLCDQGKGAANLFFRGTKQGESAIVFVIPAAAKACSVEFWGGSSDADGPEVENADRFKFVLRKWYTVRIRVRGDRCVCSVLAGDEGVISLNFKDGGHPRGMVGLSTWESSYRFKNMKVIAPDGKVLFEGLPVLPN
jgi:hypothetical protein